MLRLGAVLALLGFGSALLHFTSVQFRLLMWAEPMQPVLGLSIGGAGAVLLLIKVLTAKEEPAPPAQPMAAPSFGGPAGQQFGPPPGQPHYGAPAPQPGTPPQGFGPQGFGPRS